MELTHVIEVNHFRLEVDVSYNLHSLDHDDEDIDPEEQQRMTIAQAFADDDVIEEFRQEKDDAVEKDKPQEIDLTLPGWGSWGGQGLKVSKRKRKRLLSQFVIDWV